MKARLVLMTLGTVLVLAGVALLAMREQLVGVGHDRLGFGRGPLIFGLPVNGVAVGLLVVGICFLGWVVYRSVRELPR